MSDIRIICPCCGHELVIVDSGLNDQSLDIYIDNSEHTIEHDGVEYELGINNERRCDESG